MCRGLGLVALPGGWAATQAQLQAPTARTHLLLVCNQQNQVPLHLHTLQLLAYLCIQQLVHLCTLRCYTAL